MENDQKKPSDWPVINTETEETPEPEKKDDKED